MRPELPENPDELFARLGEPPVAPRPECEAKIRGACTGNLRPCHPVGRRLRVASCGLLVAFIFGSLLLLSRHSPSGATFAAIVGAVGWAVTMLVLLLIGFGGPRTSLGHKLKISALVLVPVGFFAHLTVGRRETLALEEFATSRHCLYAVHCGGASFVAGALVAVGIVLLWRRTDPFTPRLTGSLAGLLGGLAVLSPMGLACPGREAWHLWIGHGVSLLALVTLGAILGRRWLSP